MAFRPAPFGSFLLLLAACSSASKAPEPALTSAAATLEATGAPVSADEKTFADCQSIMALTIFHELAGPHNWTTHEVGIQVMTTRANNFASVVMQSERGKTVAAELTAAYRYAATRMKEWSGTGDPAKLFEALNPIEPFTHVFEMCKDVREPSPLGKRAACVVLAKSTYGALTSAANSTPEKPGQSREDVERYASLALGANAQAYLTRLQQRLDALTTAHRRVMGTSSRAALEAARSQSEEVRRTTAESAANDLTDVCGSAF